jgi:hypothetical protein
LLAESTVNFDSKIPSREKLTIQPILIITDDMFNIPGINKYINDVFMEQIKGINPQFNHICNLVIMDFDFLFNNLNHLKDKTINLQSVLSNYSDYIKGREKQIKARRIRDVDFEKSFISFNEYIGERLKIKKHNKFPETLFKIFDLKHGLPL